MKILTITFRALLVFLVLELCARCDDLITLGADFWKPYVRRTTIETRDEFGYTSRPNSRYHKWRLNNMGFRGDDVNIDKGPDIVRIMCAGNSATFGLIEDEGKEWPSQLGAMLYKDLKKVEIVNTAFYTYSFIDILTRLEKSWVRMEPDILILYITWDWNEQIAGGQNRVQLKSLMWENIRILQKIKDRVKESTPKAVYNIWLKFRNYRIERAVMKRPRNPVIDINKYKEMVDKDIVALNNFCKDNNMILILSTYVKPGNPASWKALESIYPYMGRNDIEKYVDTLNDTIKGTAAREHIVLVDNNGLIKGTEDILPEDPWHFSNEGAKMVAENFYNAIIKLDIPAPKDDSLR